MIFGFFKKKEKAYTYKEKRKMEEGQELKVVLLEI